MVLWGWAVTNPEGAFFPRQMGLNKENAVALLQKAWDSGKEEGERFQRWGLPSRAEHLCPSAEPSERRGQLSGYAWEALERGASLRNQWSEVPV